MILWKWSWKSTMLKRSSRRNKRSRGFKLKHAIELFVVLAICFWMLYHVKQSYGKKVALKENSIQVFAKGLNGEEILRLGRKGLNPRVDELDEALELEDEVRKLRDHNAGESRDEDEEIDASDQDKTEEGEQEQLEDLIDVDDKED